MPSYPVRNGRAIGAPPEVQDQINELMYENADWASQHQDLIRNAPPGAVDDHPEWQASQKAKRYDEAAGTNYYTGPGAQKARFGNPFGDDPGQRFYRPEEGDEPPLDDGTGRRRSAFAEAMKFHPDNPDNQPKEPWWRLLFHRKAKR